MEYLFLIILYALIMFIMILSFIFGPDRTSQIIFLGPIIIIYGGMILIATMAIASLFFNILITFTRFLLH